MTGASLVPVRDGRDGGDRLEIMTALVSAPSFDAMFRPDIIQVPPDHPVYRWECLVSGCERPRAGRGDLCGAHEAMWRQRRGEQSRAGFLRSAELAGVGEEVHERPCRICPARPSRQLTLELCHHHQFSWYHYRDRHGGDADFEAWLAGQQMPRCRHAARNAAETNTLPRSITIVSGTITGFAAACSSRSSLPSSRS